MDEKAMPILSNIEVDIVTALQVKNGRTTIKQIVQSLYELRGRLYARDTLGHMLKILSDKKVITISSSTVSLVNDLPIYREDDYQRLRKKKR